MELDILEQRLKIFSIKRENIALYMHLLVKVAIIDHNSCPFFSITETCDDYTVIIEEHIYEDLPKDAERQVAPGTWVPLTVLTDAYSASKPAGIDKIAKSLIIPLADNDISIYCLSSYQSDYLLVLKDDLPRIAECLTSNENIPKKASSLSGPVKICSKCTPENAECCSRPIVHKLNLLQNRYHVTSISTDQFNQISMTLVELLFYSEKLSEKSAKADGYEKFLSFTIVDDSVTFVMDLDTVKRFPSDSLFSNAEPWRLIKIGNPSAGLGFSECGIVAQVSLPIADANISEYYISTYNSDHTLVPESVLDEVLKLLESRQRSTDNP